MSHGKVMVDMSEFKMCPLMIGKEEHKAIAYGQGDYTVPIIYPCIGEKCMAYEKNGMCGYWLKTTKTESEGKE